MIRFCDKEVCCILEDELDRDHLISYFINGNVSETVCVLDKTEKFVGSITYDSLLGKDLKKAIKRDYVILDKNIWENGRNYFKNTKKDFGGIDLLPVLNKEHYLISFAWQDDEANRELRMLDELMMCGNALDFKDVYPEYDCVTVYGFNELACFLIKYLKSQEVAVNACGAMWKEYGIWEKTEKLAFRELTIYAEGIENKEKSVELRDSVSTEFECINCIYELNINKGIIKNSEDSFTDFLKKYKKRKIGILGIGENALNAYDLLLGYGLDIYCFISEKKEEQKKIIFGKKIFDRRWAIANLNNIIFIDPDSQNSAWGFGRVNLFHYFGYVRNRQFFVLKDYSEIPHNGLFNILRFITNNTDRKIVLAGDLRLSIKLEQILEKLPDKINGRIGYCDFLGKYSVKETNRVTQISKNIIDKDDVCLLLLPECHGRYNNDVGSKKMRKEKLIEKVVQTGMTDIVDYYTENDAFLMSSEILTATKLKTGKIVIGAINYYSGNTLFRSILDGHPDILMIDYSFLNDNLFSTCIRLSVEKSHNILSVFWKIFYEKGMKGQKQEIEKNAAKFNISMCRMLSQKQTFTSQELFVMIHVAYAEMTGREVKDITKMLIYWEPHEVSRAMCEHYALWLDKAAFSLFILNVVRNSYISYGSALRNFENRKVFDYSARRIFQVIFRYPNDRKKLYKGCQRIIIKFEDLKCEKYKVLNDFCFKVGIDWSDLLLETTINGKQGVYMGVAVGFDLAPVFNTYEEYFSAFDRFRISLITAPWQKKYGYPSVSCLNFSRREIKKMFSKEFLFEKRFKFENNEEKKKFRKWVQKLAVNILWETRFLEITDRF